MKMPDALSSSALNLAPDRTATQGTVRLPPLPPADRPAGRRTDLSSGVKRALDVAVAAFLLALTAPLMLIIALAVRLTSGAPVFFRQERVGRNGAQFTLYKFRSMKNGFWGQGHQNVVMQQLQAPHARRRRKAPFHGPDRRKSHHKPVPSPQLTALGRFLRKTSLDELPQLFNILKGDMSLVGPRPPIPYEIAFHKPHELQRLAVPPGLTGLWQVSGRYQLNYREMIQLDLEYIRKQSLWLDLKILLKTPWALFDSR